MRRIHGAIVIASAIGRSIWLRRIHELTVGFWGDVGIESPTIVDAAAAGRHGLPCDRVVHHADRYRHELDAAVAVPDKQFATARDVLARLVVNVAATTVCTEPQC